MTKKILQILNNLPSSPGVYKMIDGEGKIIYIGKAKNLKKRVKQYFQKNYEHSTRTLKMVEKIEDIKYTVVDSELEAMILETTLIKELQPKYNVIMKDDKNYVYIKITKEDFPRIQIVRKVLNDGAKYIGPKSASNKVTETLKVLKRVFPFRHCGLDLEWVGNNKVKVTNKVLKYPCIDYYIKTCPAPCIAKCTPEEYRKSIEYIERFLEGKIEGITEGLYKQMQELATKKDFEKAAKLRDRIKKIEDILEHQKVSDPNYKDTDVINYYVANEKAYFNLFQIREGKLIGQENFVLSAESSEENSTEKEILESFILQYYSIAQDFPEEILVPHDLEEIEEVQIFLKKQSPQNTKITVPKIGDKNKLLEMSLKNAQIYADRHRSSWQEEGKNNANAIKELQKILNIEKPLKRIECYDISHLSGLDTVGSMVVFENGTPKKNMYRKFHLRTVQGKPDDYRSLTEVLTRRLSRFVTDEQNKEYTFKKATKKYQKQIEEITKKENLRQGIGYENFYILEKNKKSLAAFASIQNHSPKASEINDLFVLPEERGNKIGQKLIKNLINKTKGKRVYLVCKKELKDYYLSIGFEEIKTAPEEIQVTLENCKACSIKGPLIVAYDKAKHKPDESFIKMPDLLVIDGGRGQLNICTKVLHELKLNIAHISLAKDKEEIFEPTSEKSLILPRNNEALKLLQRLRNEAHRFAISYNTNLRGKRMLNN